MSGIKLLKLSFNKAACILRGTTTLFLRMSGEKVLIFVFCWYGQNPLVLRRRAARRLEVYGRPAFISLYMLQALFFITGFCGTIIYKVQRMSSAHYSRVQALSDRSLLKSIYPFVLAQLDNLPLPIEQAPMKVSINIGGCSKKLLIQCKLKTDTEKVISIVVLSSTMQVKSSVYVFFTKTRDEKEWTSRGVQFGNFL